MRREQVYWGWGEPGAGPVMGESAAALLRDALGVSGEVISPPVAADAVRLRPAADAPALRAALAGAVGEAHVRSDDAIRLLRAAGKSYLDLLALRAGDAGEAPDVVVAPGSADEVRGGAARLRGGRRGGGAVRGRDERGRRRGRGAGRLRRGRLPRPRADGPGPRGRRAVAPRGGGRRHPAAGARPRARRARAAARAPPAELRVGDGRRLRGHPLRRPGLDGLRPLRRPRRRGAVRDAGGGARPAGGARLRRGARSHPARAGLGGDARRDRGADAAGPARRRGDALRGVGGAVVRRRLRDAPRARPGRGGPGRRAALRRAGDGPHDRPGRASAGRCATARATAAC